MRKKWSVVYEQFNTVAQEDFYFKFSARQWTAMIGFYAKDWTGPIRIEDAPSARARLMSSITP